MAARPPPGPARGRGTQSFSRLPGHAERMVGQQKQVVEVDGRRIPLTNLDKVLYPATGFTKGDVLAYYAAVASALVPLTAGRPATRKRWPDGVGAEGAEARRPFFVKNLETSAPDWVPRGTVDHRSGSNTYPRVDDLATLTWLAQLATLEVHVPQWRFDSDGAPGRPDRLVLDLDPGEGAGLPECAAVARLLRPILAGMDLEALPVTSGSKGLHLYAHLDGRWTSDHVAEVAHELARALEADAPDLVVSDMKKAVRGGKVLVDWSQNRAAKTTLVPYSLRGTPRPTAAAPRTWAELDDPGLAQLTPDDVVTRLRLDGDLLADLAPAGARADALTRYRSMRDAAATPEPVPAASPAGGPGNTFVIQEHHATALHWDLRLERDGVLVSWALPKGVPAEGERNHLAVHTEDHPLEYASFEGDIPAGEYGGGHVDLWDAGVFEAEKFRDDEVIATLTGRPDGGLGGAPVRIALIRTGDATPDHAKERWLVHRMKPASAAAPPPRHVRQPAERAAAGAPRPMLATASGSPAAGERWAVEMKWDGVRAIAVVEDGAVTLTSRNETDLTPTYPELQALAERVHAGRAVLDGEIVAPDDRGRPSFSRLQQRMGLTRAADVAAARRTQAVRLLLFDVLEVDGTGTLQAPWQDRRDLLERLVEEGGPVDVPPVVAEAEGDELGPAIEEAMATSRRLGLEGVLIKRAGSPYRSGARSGDWLKRKHERQQEVVVGGWREGRGRRQGGVGSLLVGVRDGERLVYAGRVGTGFSDDDLDAIERRLASRGRATTPFEDVPRADAGDAHWVTPDLVGEVRFAEWTDDDRLRHAAWRGWRPDKRPEDVVREP